MALQQLEHTDTTIDECIDHCSEAAQACEWCADACLDEGADMARCVRLCRDVADLTTVHARFMARNSGYHTDLAAVCADACDACAEECATFDHEHCQVCAEAVSKAAESCRAMASD
ncbi:MAG: four-helix bundle copper-binding protein [Natrialbaceae archaeon]|nr:four-helix bundle copper-binding protein [Natrialbaceae archaeon]